MPIVFELIGGPPWGFRISQDADLRPIVAQILLGGRGDVGGLRIGDVIAKIGTLSVNTSKEAHSLVHATEGLLQIQVERDAEKYHQTVRNEKLSSSANNSPIIEKRQSTSSVPSTPVLPRTNPHHSRNSPRQVRMDMMKGSRNSTDNKRKLFEEFAETNSPSIVDHLLKKKIQMGLNQGAQTSSSAGYDSVGADFAGEMSTSSIASRNSPGSSIGGTSSKSSKEEDEEEDTEQITVVENTTDMNGYNPPTNQMVHDSPNLNRMEYFNQNPSPIGYHEPHHQNILSDQPSSSSSQPQWNVRTEQQSTMPAQGDIEVPVRRNVAALRQVINDRLEMKTPTGGQSSSRPKTPQEPVKPSWASSVKVYEPNGFQDPHKDKHNMGRVLDGPVNPNKYFQGVPPPSYSQVPTEAKPPAPPSKPAPPKTSSTIRLPPELSQNHYHQQYQHQPHQPQQIHQFSPRQPISNHPRPTNQQQFDQMMAYSHDPRYPYGSEDMDDGASMISSCISTFGDSSEIAAISAAGAQRNLYDQYRRNLMNPPHRDDPTPTTIPEEMSISASTNEKSESTLTEPPRTVYSDAFSSNQIASNPPLSSSLFNSDIQLTPFGQTNSSTQNQNQNQKSPTPNPNLTRSGSRHSLDLESSELLVKSKSPAPYSTQTADHYGTIRRRHNPVKVDLESPDNQSSRFSFTSPPPARIEHRSCDSGYEGSNAISPEQTSMRLEKALSDAFDLHSSLASSMNNVGIDGSESGVDSRRPDSFMSSSTFDTNQQHTLLSPSSTSSVPTPMPISTAVSSISNTSSPPHTPRLLSQQVPASTPQPLAAGAVPTSSSSTSNPPTGGSAVPILEIDPEDQMYPKRHFHSTTEPEMSLWYKKMFKQMHKPGDEEEAQHQSQTQSQYGQNDQQLKELDLAPQDQTARVSRSAQRVEVDIVPRRARSVGRVITPGEESEEGQAGNPSNNGTSLAANLFALERSKTPHFHLPSYKFRDEDPRPIRCSFGGCSRRPCTSSGIDENGEKATFGTRCMVCRQPKKNESFADVDRIYEKMETKRIRDEKEEQKKKEIRQVADKLDETTKELNVFIQQLEQTWQRSKSQPVIRIATGSGSDNYSKPPSLKKRTQDTNLAAQIEELKRISKEEELVRQKAEKLTDELQKEKDRRHNYVPSAAPSLHTNMDRFEGLVKDYSSRTERSPMRLEDDLYSQSGRPVVVTATAIYKFDARSARELPLNRGDIIRIIREVDSHWMEGERNGRSGIFPASYVQVESEFDRSRQKMRAFYPFTARNSNELSLKKGEIVTFRREIDMNWIEGSNQIGIIGIFPSSYVRILSDPPQDAPTASIPDRPKTPQVLNQQQSQQQSQNQNQNHRVRFEEPIYHENNSRFDALPNDSVETSIPIGTSTSQIQSQSYEKPVDHRLNEWESRKYASNPSDEWAAQDRILDQVRKPAESSSFRTNQQGQNQNQSHPQYYHQESEPVIKGSDLRSNPASVVPKGSEVFRAMFSYRPQKEDELELFVNDIIFVVEKCDDGWFIGTSLRTGDFGIFPGNYVQRH